MSRRHRPLLCATGALAMMVLSGCGGSPEASGGNGTGGGGGAVQGAVTAEPGALPPGEFVTSSSTPAAGQTPAAPARSGSGGTAVAASPSPFETPWTPEIPVESFVQPSCIRPGGKATLTVQTTPKAGIAYHALYAGTKGGAPPPFGSGYGGNDKGFVNDDGRYVSSWIVSPEAPAGPARVDVIVGWDGKWGYDDPPFWVADASGRC